jgi:phosphohistidine phosphatase SixA
METRKYLLIMRHGHYDPVTRQLTEDGRELLETKVIPAILDECRKLGVTTFEQIFYSPQIRTSETAGILARYAEVTPEHTVLRNELDDGNGMYPEIMMDFSKHFLTDDFLCKAVVSHGDVCAALHTLLTRKIKIFEQPGDWALIPLTENGQI